MELIIKINEEENCSYVYVDKILRNGFVNEVLDDKEQLFYEINTTINKFKPLNKELFEQIEQSINRIGIYNFENTNIVVKLNEVKGNVIEVQCLRTYKGMSNGGFIATIQLNVFTVI